MGVETRALTLSLLLLLVPATTFAGDHVPFSAREGLPLALDAARSWEPDAMLIYAENDTEVDSLGKAIRWGYLFFSPGRDKARAYSVRDAKIVVARDLGFQFEAPPVPGNWIDSAVALAAAEEKAGIKYRQAHEGTLSTVVLMRGAFHEKDPDVTTWTLIYTSPDAPSLFVMVDAATGKVKRTWRG
jgi:hypothetical protein